MTELEQFVFLCVKQAHQRFCQSSVKQAITEFAFTFLQSFFFLTMRYAAALSE